MIRTLTGPNDFMRIAALHDLQRAFIAEHGDFGLEKLDASEVDFGRLLESVSSLPFLASRRMIILSGIGADKTMNENIDALLDAVADTTDLIIHEPKFDKRLSSFKTLKKRTDLHEYTDLDERGLQTWLVGESKSRGGTLSAADARLLIDRAGFNQLSLSNELDKLLSYDPSITKQSIELLVEPLPQGSVFDLLDAAFAGNRQKAMKLYDDQRRQQVEPQAIMGMIAWQVHSIAVAKLNEGLGVDEIARAAKLNPFVVRKSLGAARGMSEKDIKALVGRAVELDVRLKSESVDADDAVRHFLLTI